MNIEKLIKMANDIADFFNAENDKDIAATGVMKHILRSWDPRMKREIIKHCKEGGGGGFHSMMRVYPSAGLGTVIMTNTTGFKVSKTVDVLDRRFLAAHT